MFSLTQMGTGGVADFTVNNALNGANALSVTTNGGGNAGRFEFNNAASFGSAIWATSNSRRATLYAENTGSADPNASAATFVTTNAASVASTVGITQNGLSRAMSIGINNAGNTNDVIYASTNGSGSVYRASADGTGSAGLFSVTNAASGATVLGVSTLGTGMGISAITTSNTAISGASTTGTGISASSTSGAGLSASSTNGNAVNATSTNGVGVSASSTNGPGLTAATGSATQYAATFTGTAIGSHGIQINAGAGGMAINVVRGGLIASYTTVASGGAIPSDYIVVEVQDDLAGGVPATATLPLVATNGQIIITSTNDPDGLFVNGVGQGTFDTRRWTYTGGIWKAEF
jgi:hypothetical protein